VGIPINEFKFSNKEIIKFRQGLSLNLKLPTVLMIGGGNGSDNLNEIIGDNLDNLLTKFNILHQAGEGKQISFKTQKSHSGVYLQFGFCSQVDMQHYIEVADVVISRAGATSIQELAFKSKATIIIASPYLSDQIKNAEYLKKKNAALILNELELYEKPDILSDAIDIILNNKDKWGRGINKIYISGAAKRIADCIVSLL
jgi:UDP-N-acetylglucosamine--N-acetylmuramyl-(pentapeptide) pyrophosphoryl-undecaprenol N-acetylglucosamine transferase